MYEAPDRYKRLISARLPGGESAGVSARESDSDSSPLRDVQLMSRAQLAPFFAAANVVAALILVASMWGAVPPEWLIGWAGSIAIVNFGLMQLDGHQSITCVGRSGRRVPSWQLVGEVLVRACVFLAVPLFFFPSLDPGTQVITASVIAGLAVGGLGLVVIPQSAIAWMIAFTGGVGGALLLGRHTVPFHPMLSILFTLGVSIAGVLTVARWAFGQLKATADFGSQSEGAALLLQEYEQRGVGWLWAVDAENRVTYISARMSVMLNRPANQLLGHSLPALLGGNAELGQVLLEKQTFNSLEMELGTPRGLRWISMSGDPIIDTAGRFEGFRGVGSDITQSRKTVEQLAARIIASIREPYMIDQTEIRIGVSIGCAFGPIDGATVDDLILKADLALYQAKDAGRGCARYFSSELQSEQEDRVRLENDLRSAIASKQFHLVFQPLINARNQKLVGFEALLRWNHPQRGFVPPNVFIPVAEEAGLMPALGEWIIDEACRATATWPEPITVALNISPKQIQPGLPNFVSEALARHKVPGNRIELEVTEGVFLGDNGSTLDVLKRLRTLGVGIALDDFGTGYSSIGYLNKAIFHKLKIDGSFVREAGSRPENVAIIQSIVQLAKSFRMNVTAEGVETAEDFERMRDLGCDTIQGYLFGKPLSYERASQMVLGLGAKRLAG